MAVSDRATTPRAKLGLYHTARWVGRLYLFAVVVALAYGSNWIIETAGLIPDGYIGTLWASLSVLLVIIGAVFVPLLLATTSDI
ncbi:hypothetical protein [Natronolimnobius baerhuensis]|uniref:Uncharacterized protein n=1 Tax=Natronolimnobius baerhuensis TaxID=253108 RepID=A0A202E585_9EURY|nr:hypothetical protein [Natronolimnobius baerhuensis]OVE83358.1 hypothetical protein B2G88_12910 [Natronolimnobius baerhuensis]